MKRARQAGQASRQRGDGAVTGVDLSGTIRVPSPVAGCRGPIGRATIKRSAPPIVSRVGVRQMSAKRGFGLVWHDHEPNSGFIPSD